MFRYSHSLIPERITEHGNLVSHVIYNRNNQLLSVFFVKMFGVNGDRLSIMLQILNPKCLKPLVKCDSTFFRYLVLVIVKKLGMINHCFSYCSKLTAEASLLVVGVKFLSFSSSCRMLRSLISFCLTAKITHHCCRR